MLRIDRIRVLGVPVDAVDMQTALDYVDSRVADRGARPGYVVAINPEKTFAIRRDPQLRDFVEDASLLIPDGIGVVLAARLLHGARIGRVAGADLMLEICRHSTEIGHRIFIFGASEDVNRDAVAELRRRFAQIKLVGRANGYVRPEQMETLVDEINESEADILFIALGSPRQEQWISKYAEVLKVDMCLGIGGTLDTIVGKVPRAPLFFRKVGLEWFYRLARQPSRIVRQIALPQFAWQVLSEKACMLVGRTPRHCGQGGRGSDAAIQFHGTQLSNTVIETEE